MVDSGFRIAVDPLFPPPSYSKRMNQSLPFTHWELVFDSDIDGPEVETLLNPEKTNQTACSNLTVIKEWNSKRIVLLKVAISSFKRVEIATKRGTCGKKRIKIEQILSLYDKN